MDLPVEAKLSTLGLVKKLLNSSLICARGDECEGHAKISVLYSLLHKATECVQHSLVYRQTPVYDPLKIVLFGASNVSQAEVVQVNGQQLDKSNCSSNLVFVDMVLPKYLIDMPKYILVSFVGCVRFERAVIFIFSRAKVLWRGQGTLLVCPVPVLVKNGMQHGPQVSRKCL